MHKLNTDADVGLLAEADDLFSGPEDESKQRGDKSDSPPFPHDESFVCSSRDEPSLADAVCQLSQDVVTYATARIPCKCPARVRITFQLPNTSLCHTCTLPTSCVPATRTCSGR